MADYSVHRIPFDQVPQFSKIDCDYATRPDSFDAFIEHLPSMDGLSNAIEKRKEVSTNRPLLVKVLKKQYAEIGCENKYMEGLEQSNHFTVITAHQPSLFTGPLYFIYKICSTINLARKLNETHKETIVHPVFIIGGEDHDFEEINHIEFFGKRFEWNSDENGAVGRMSTTSMKEVIAQILDVFGTSPFSEQLSELISSCFPSGISYGKAMQEFVVRLFDDTELIVLQMDDPELKAQFAPIIRDEILNQSSAPIVRETQDELSALGYKPQAFVREINLFYLNDQIRSRIELADEVYNVIDTDLTFTKEEILALIDTHPERFSPNVNLRPLYQELILPNLAYIGGGGELAYWLERRKQFEFYELPFPVLIRRNSVLYLNRGLSKQKTKLDISNDQLFDNPDHEISVWIRSHSENEVDISLELQELDDTIERIVTKATAIDPSFASKVEAFKVRMLKEVDHMGKRLVREEKAKYETTVGKIKKLYEKLFPSGSLQERKENFIPQYLAHGPAFFSKLIEELDPLEAGMVIIEEV